MNFSNKEFRIIQDRLIPADRIDRNSIEMNLLDEERVLEMASWLGFNVEEALANFNQLRLKNDLPEFQVDTIESHREMSELFDTLLLEDSLQKLDEDFTFLQQTFAK